MGKIRSATAKPNKAKTKTQTKQNQPISQVKRKNCETSAGLRQISLGCIGILRITDQCIGSECRQDQAGITHHWRKPEGRQAVIAACPTHPHSEDPVVSRLQMSSDYARNYQCQPLPVPGPVPWGRGCFPSRLPALPPFPKPLLRSRCDDCAECVTNSHGLKV